jgi:hypothetical protein
MPLFTVVCSEFVKWQELPIPFLARIGRPLRLAVNRVLIDGIFRLRTLRVVTQSATRESFPTVGAVTWRNQHSSKQLRVAGSGRMVPAYIGVILITVPSGIFGRTR